MKIIFCLLFIICAGRCPAAENNTGSLTVQMAGFRGDAGAARVLLFRGKEGFPKDYKKTYRIITSSITNGSSEAVFANLPAGSYAVAVLHDEKFAGKMETNWLGIPRSGVGTSNNVTPFLSPPSYKVSSFEAGAEPKTIAIKMKYFLGK